MKWQYYDPPTGISPCYFDFLYCISYSDMEQAAQLSGVNREIRDNNEQWHRDRFDLSHVHEDNGRQYSYHERRFKHTTSVWRI